MRDAYEKILTTAVKYANADIGPTRKPWYLGGDIFRVPLNFGSLALWYEPSIVKGAIQSQRDRGYETRTEAEVMAGLTDVVQSAIVKAIAEEGEAFGALIMSEVRKD